jgi:hypothetical protein
MIMSLCIERLCEGIFYLILFLFCDFFHVQPMQMACTQRVKIYLSGQLFLTDYSFKQFHYIMFLYV